MQYYYHGAEDGSLSKQDMTVTIYGNKDGYDSHYGILDGVSDYYGAASTTWRNAKNKDKSKSLYTLKKMACLAQPNLAKQKEDWTNSLKPQKKE